MRWLRSSAVGSLVLAFVARAIAIAWAAGRFPPTGDGAYYHRVAQRIADGAGYTWVWPDGAVTYAAHYPVGFPAMVGGCYAMLGSSWTVAALPALLVGAGAAAAAADLARRTGGERAGWLAGIAVALHPALVAYAPALMTEGLVGGLLVIAAAVAARGGRFGVVAVGLLAGVATLTRPQVLLLAPVLGILVSGARAAEQRSKRGVLGDVAAVTAIALCTCLPWTLRNCMRMDSCTFVSANAGWNLLIGTEPTASGSWVPVEQAGMPERCREVFAEVAKDRCFLEAGVERVLAAPGRWLSAIPAKLAATFDYAGAAGWYLHASNAERFTGAHKYALGVAETVWQRSVLICCLVSLMVAGARQRARRVIALASLPFALMPQGWVAYVGLVFAAAARGPEGWREQPAALAAGAAVAATALVHAVFFGAGRYSLVCMPLMAALAGTVVTLQLRGTARVLTRRGGPRDTPR